MLDNKHREQHADAERYGRLDAADARGRHVAFETTHLSTYRGLAAVWRGTAPTVL
jgi:hypothetical protein